AKASGEALAVERDVGVNRTEHPCRGLRADADLGTKAAERLNPQADPPLRMRTKVRQGTAAPLPHICLGWALPWHQSCRGSHGFRRGRCGLVNHATRKSRSVCPQVRDLRRCEQE